MPDFYVDVASGDDTADGSATRPVRTIARATELAAADDFASGTIFVANGTYGALERFPILVPPPFALHGGSREGCVIRFTGRTMGSWYDGTALQPGRRVANLTVAAAPPSGELLACNWTVGIDVRVDDTVLVDVGVRVASDAPEDGAPFGEGIFVRADNVSARRLYCTDYNLVLVVGAGGIFEDCVFSNAPLHLSAGTVRVEDCEFSGRGSRCSVDGLATGSISRNRFVNGSQGAGMRRPARSSVPAGRFRIHDNRFIGAGRGLGASGGAPLIEGNTVVVDSFAVVVGGDASPLIRDNTFQVENDWAFTAHPERSLIRAPVILVGGDATPAFENNRFIEQSRHLLYYAALVEAAADFGGGGRSAGGNRFGQITSPIRIALPAGGTVFARNNYWRFGTPSFSTDPTWHFQRNEETVVDVTGAMVDPDATRWP